MAKINTKPAVIHIALTLCLCVTVLRLLTTPTPALAATLSVTTSADSTVNDGDCSLREAIINANDNANTWTDCTGVGYGNDTISFAASVTTVTLSAPLPNITDAAGLTIDGLIPNGMVTLDGDGTYRVLSVDTGAILWLADLHIYDGQATGADGGAILNNGTLYLNNSFLSQNYAGQNGGAIFNASGSTVEITNSTLEFNQSNMDGGGIYNEGTLTVANSTLWENSANLAMSYYGGGIYNANGSTLTILNSTLSNNWNTNVFNASGGTFNFANTILANSDDCRNYGTIGTNTNNLIEYESNPALSCAGLDTIKDDPQLIQPTADNGGPTPTLALATGSLAIDAGDDAICAAAPINNLDQRGVARPQYTHCDIGAFEVDNLAPNDISISNTSVDENLPVGSFVGSLTTTDPDIGDTHTYNLQSGIPGCSAAGNSSFQIPPSSNQLQTAVIFDYETPPTSFSVCIRTTDSGGLTYEEPFTITINDVDDTAPSVNTILRQVPPTSPTNATTVTFRVTFSEDVQNVDGTDFNLVTTGTVTGGINTVIVQSASVYDVQVTGVSGDGTLSLGFATTNDIEDLSGNPLGPSPTIGIEELYTIDNSPIVVIVGGVVGNPDSLTIYDGGIYATQFTQLEIAYNVDANDLGGGSNTDDVTNPNNYLLLQTGPNGTYNTLNCAGYASNGNLPLGDDIQIMTNPVTYNNNGGAGPFVAVVTLNGGAPLPYGEYRLMICGTTSITDLVDNPLNGGTDSVLTFQVGVIAMPATGFAPGHQASLPIQHERLTYTSMGNLWLEIPRLNVSSDIIGVPLVETVWDVTWLGHDVGWLEGTAFPTWEGNTVITGHVWDAANRPGILSNLHKTRWNDKVIIHAWGWKYTYEVRTVDTLVKPEDTRLLTKHEDLDWVTLVTCRGYDEQSESYSWRTVVRAVLVKVEME
jgi:LPXTG-site transpeptidase (sortase) family protein